MTYECLLYEVKDGVATLTLNRPDRLNALGGSRRDDLHDAMALLKKGDFELPLQFDNFRD